MGEELLADGPTGRVASTIVDLTTATGLAILREGAMNRAAVEKVLGRHRQQSTPGSR
ncbi:hypothetical protein NKH77_06900 [Streptomyces sp. M19]